MSPLTRINAEIHSCLEQIEAGAPAIARLAGTLDRLRSDPAWSAYEIRQVEFGVRHILSNLVTANNDGV
jgi:hypothetical protein